MKKIPVFYRVMIVVFLVGVALIVNSFSCIMLSIKRVPTSITKNSTGNIAKIIFLYDETLCGTCPSGAYLWSLKDRTDILFIVPKELNQFEKKNLVNSFMIQGKVIDGDEETEIFLQRLANCSRKGKWKKNFYAELDLKNKKFEKIKVF